MHLEDVPRSRPLMKVINVLRDDQNIAGMPRLKFSKCAVRTVWLRLTAVGATHVIEFVNEIRIASKGLRRCHLLKIEPGPEAVLIPEGTEPGLGGYPGAGENDYIQSRFLSIFGNSHIVRQLH